MLTMVEQDNVRGPVGRHVNEARAEPDIAHLLRRLHRSMAADETVALLSDRRGLGEIVGTGSSHASAGDWGELARDVANTCAKGDRDKADVFIARFTSPTAAGGVLAICVNLDGRASLTVVALRLDPAKIFGQNDERAVRRMADWIGDHLKLWWQLRCQRRRGAGVRAALDFAGEAVFVLDRDARLLNINRTARLLLEVGDGLRATGDALTASNLEDSVRLHAAINHVGSLASPSTGTQHAPVVSVRRKDRRPLSVAVACAPGDAGEDPAIILLAVDPEADLDAMMSPACRLYGLTGTEARLTRLLVGGANLGEAAVAMQIQEPTARSYLKQVFVKAGVNRQASLVRLMLTSLIRTGPGIVLTPL